MKKKLLVRFKNIYTYFRNPSIIFYIKKSILLNTIPKSGTNFLRLLLTNYFLNYSKVEEHGIEAFRRIGYFEMDNQLFPNVRSDFLNRAKPFKKKDVHPKSLLNGRYSDFMYDHGHAIDYTLKLSSWVKYFFSNKVILLYRNPLDQMVSWYFYEYIGKQGRKENFTELIDALTANYIRHYKRTMLLHEKLKNQSILISYESLVIDPDNMLKKVIIFLDLPVNDELISASVEASSKKAVKNEEKKHRKNIHNQNLKSKSFIRSGLIGDWKNHIDEISYKEIKQKLNRENISLENFILQ